MARTSSLFGSLGLFSLLATAFTGLASLADWHEGRAARLGSDLTLVAIVAVSSLVFVPLARWLAAREGPAARADRAARAGSIPFGIVCASLGVLMLGAGAYHAAQVPRPTFDDYMFAPAAMIFILGGAMLASAGTGPRVNRWLGAALLSAFAITLDWVAFAPGERHFTGGISLGFAGAGLAPGPWLGRAVFGIAGAAMTIAAASGWARALRRD